MKIIKLKPRPEPTTHNSNICNYEYEITPGEWVDIKNKEQLLVLTSLSFNIRKKS